MRLAQGPRPWTIWLFALVSTAFAINGLWQDLSEFGTATRHLWWAPSSRWSEEELIVVACTAFTIKLIPILLVWVFASSFARWFILAMTILPIPFALLQLPIQLAWMRENGFSGEQARVMLMWSGMWIAITFLLVALLFLPASNRWFARPKDEGADASA